MDAGNLFAGSSSSDDSTTHHHHHHHHHALGMLISFTVLACGIMLEDCCGPIAGTILLVLVGLMDGLSITMKPIGNENAKNLEEMPPAASGSHGAVDQGKKTPFISLLSPFSERIDVEDTSANGHEKRSNPALESKKKSENIDSRKELEKPSNLVVESKGKSESIDSRKGHKKRLNPVFESKRKSKNVDSGLEKRSNPVLESRRKLEHIDLSKGPEKRLRPVVESKRKSENIGSTKVHVKRSNFIVESKKKSENVDSGKEHETRLRPAVESKTKSENIDLRCKQDKKVVGTHRMSPCFAPARGDASVVVRSGFVRPTLIRDGKSIGYENRQGKDKQLTSVMESKRKSEKVDLSMKQDKNVVNMHRMIPHVVSASLSEFVQPTSISKGGKPIESQKHKEKQLSSVVESRRKSEHFGLVRKQDKQVVGTQRTIPSVVPAQGHTPVVRSGLVRPTLIQKGSKLIGSEKFQGPEKLLSSAVESKRKSGYIDSRRKNDKNVVGTLKDLVDERSPQSVSKHKNFKAVPQVQPYKGRTNNSTSELKARWKF